MTTDTSCDAGTFFNTLSLKCELCEPGFYSLGKLYTLNNNLLSTV